MRHGKPERDMNDPAEQPPKPSKSGSQKRHRKALLGFRATPDEHSEIAARAERAGLRLSGYLRALVFGKDTPQPRAARRPPVETTELIRLRYELRKIGGNLNQIAHRLNQGKEFDDRALTVVCEEHTAVLKMIMQALGKETPEPPEAKSGLAEKLFGKSKAPP